MKYDKGKIYAIRSNKTKYVYYGSTTQLLCNRLSSHKYDYKKYLEGKHGYVTSFEILKYDDSYIELIENFPCISREELERREGEIIRANNNCVNKQIAGRTKKEWRADNKVKIKSDGTKYRKSNNDLIKTQKKKSYERDKHKVNEVCECICGKSYTKCHLSRHVKSKHHTSFVNTQI